MIHCNKLKNIPTRVNIIGVPISVVNMESCISFLFSNWDAVHGNYVCVSNVHTTVMAHDDPQYYKVQSESLLSVPDGKPLSVIGKKKFPQMNRVTGPDLMRRLFEESKEKKIRHYFYGFLKKSKTIIRGLKLSVVSLLYFVRSVKKRRIRSWTESIKPIRILSGSPWVLRAKRSSAIKCRAKSTAL